jgi:hypothetical protein
MGIDSAYGIGSLKQGVCTSSTRPASPFEGQQIYETDTDKVSVWNGSAWYPNWNLPWGQVGYAKSTTGLALTGAFQDIPGVSVTWTAVSGRLYKMSYYVYFIVTAGSGSVFATLADASGTRVTEGSAYGTATSYPTVSPILYTTGLSGSTTRKVKVLMSGITTASTLAATDYPSVLIVEDIGPA